MSDIFGMMRYDYRMIKKYDGGVSLKYRTFYLLFAVFALFFLGGCGTNEELEQYKSDMETFYTELSGYDDRINSIDVSSETAVPELLAALDEMKERFSWMASLKMPEEFAVVEDLAVQAEEYMADAVSLYHQAYESDPFDSAAAQTAHMYYERANKRAVYILAILHGELPEEDDLEEETE